VEYNNGSNNNLDQSNGDVIVGKIVLKKITIMTKIRMNIIYLFFKFMKQIDRRLGVVLQPKQIILTCISILIKILVTCDLV
jgi:hypothetical protein